MMEETSEGRQQFHGEQSQGDIGIKGTQDHYNQQQNPYPQSGYQNPSYQPAQGPPGTYYPPGPSPKFPLIPVSPYARGLALSVVMMAIGGVIERFFIRAEYYWYGDSPFYYFGMVLFYIGAIMAFLFALGLFLLPPRQDQSERGSSNVHLGLAFVLAAIILGIALH
jgi:hypothetical protein